MAFASVGGGKCRRNQDKSDITWYVCGKMGHNTNNFPEREQNTSGNVVAMVIDFEDGEVVGYFTFAMLGEMTPNSYETYKPEGSWELSFIHWGGIRRGKVDPWWLMLLSGSTVNLFCNSNMLTNTEKARKGIRVHYNGGNMYTDEARKLDGYGEVWMCREGHIKHISPL